MITQKKATWEAEGKLLFGEKQFFRFRCPACGHIATPLDFRDLGQDGGLALSNCIGRYTKDKGCDWTAGGFLGTLGKGRIVQHEQGSNHEFFDFDNDTIAPVVDDLTPPPHPAAGIERWEEYVWEEWIPEEVRSCVMRFWASSSHRSPDSWAKDSVVQRAPAHGSVVTLSKLTGNTEETGRFVHAWNNIGRIVKEDGSVVCVSF